MTVRYIVCIMVCLQYALYVCVCNSLCCICTCVYLPMIINVCILCMHELNSHYTYAIATYIVIGFNYLEAVIGVNGTLGTLLVGYLVSLGMVRIMTFICIYTYTIHYSFIYYAITCFLCGYNI